MVNESEGRGNKEDEDWGAGAWPLLAAPQKVAEERID